MKFIRIIMVLFISVFLLNSCQKEYSYEKNKGQISAGSWEFTNAGTKYAGDMDTVYQATAGSTKELFLIGTTKDGKQKFEMHLFADTFKITQYKASLFQSSFLYSASGNKIYEASQLIGEFIVNVTSLDDESIAGNFSGSAQDSTGKIIELGNGKFQANFGSGTVNPSSSGVLGDGSGNCTKVISFGSYGAGVPTDNTNSVQLEVTVTTPGSYTISTNTVNGISFSKSGNFVSTGPQNILLNASGTPTTAGQSTFILHYGNSQCSFTLNILGDATGVLGSGNGDCTPFTLAGTYQQGIPFNSGNTVKIQVNASTPGSYHINTNSVNGVSFSGMGIFSATGLQDVILTGTGTPLNSGLQNFSVSYGTSTCSFPITFLSEVAASNDYFPVSLNSNWTYKLTTDTNNVIANTLIDYSPTLAGQQYNTISSQASIGTEDSLYYRKPGGDYFEYVNFSKFLGFDQFVGSEFIFLKDNVGVSQTWNSPTINGTINGNPVSGYAKMTILEKGVAVTTIPLFNFPDVIKVKYEFFINGVPTPVLTQERWFAKNTGEIYFTYNNGAQNLVYQVSDYKVF